MKYLIFKTQKKVFQFFFFTVMQLYRLIYPQFYPVTSGKIDTKHGI